jgi:hypothetical protein
VLLRPEQAKAAKGKSNVVISEPRVIAADDKVLGKRVKLEKAPNATETLKITIPGGKCNKEVMQNSSSPKVQRLVSGR